MSFSDKQIRSVMNEDHVSRGTSAICGVLIFFAYCCYIAWIYLHEYSTAQDMAARALGTTIDDPRWTALMSKYGVDNLIWSALPEVILQKIWPGLALAVLVALAVRWISQPGNLPPVVNVTVSPTPPPVAPASPTPPPADSGEELFTSAKRPVFDPSVFSRIAAAAPEVQKPGIFRKASNYLGDLGRELESQVAEGKRELEKQAETADQQNKPKDAKKTQDDVTGLMSEGKPDSGKT